MPVDFPTPPFSLDLPKASLSVSQIEAYWKCPAAYRFRYVLGRKSGLTSSAAEGICLARVFEETNHKWMDCKRHLTPRQAVSSWKKFWPEYAGQVEKWDQKEADIRERMDWWLASGDPSWKEYRPVFAEEQFSTMIAGVKVVGIPDMVEAHRITDFKCAREPKRYQPKRSLQLAFYAVHHGISDVRFRVFCKETSAIVDKEATLNLDKAQRWLEYVVPHVARAISLDVFPPCDPNQNGLCSSKWCAYWKDCYGKCISG